MKNKNLFDDIKNMKTLDKYYEVYEIKYVDKRTGISCQTKINDMTFKQFAKKTLEEIEQDK